MGTVVQTQGRTAYYGDKVQSSPDSTLATQVREASWDHQLHYNGVIHVGRHTAHRTMASCTWTHPSQRPGSRIRTNGSPRAIGRGRCDTTRALQMYLQNFKTKILCDWHHQPLYPSDDAKLDQQMESLSGILFAIITISSNIIVSVEATHAITRGRGDNSNR